MPQNILLSGTRNKVQDRSGQEPEFRTPVDDSCSGGGTVDDRRSLRNTVDSQVNSDVHKAIYSPSIVPHLAVSIQFYHVDYTCLFTFKIAQV